MNRLEPEIGEMKLELQLKLQAYLDGELPARETSEVTDWLARDAEARALLAELQNTRGALKTFEAELKLPESREFYWSGIQRRIGQLERTPSVDEPPAWLSALLRRFLAPAGALAALVIAATLITRQLHPGGATAAMEAETAFGNAFTYRDYASGTTLVWLSYPAENGFADFLPSDTLR